MVRDTKYFSNFRKEIYVKELKMTTKFKVNFLSMVLKYTLSLAISVLRELSTSPYLFIIIRM